jgi:hypothetical protein
MLIWGRHNGGLLYLTICQFVKKTAWHDVWLQASLFSVQLHIYAKILVTNTHKRTNAYLALVVEGLGSPEDQNKNKNKNKCGQTRRRVIRRLFIFVFVFVLGFCIRFCLCFCFRFYLCFCLRFFFCLLVFRNFDSFPPARSRASSLNEKETNGQH